MPSQKHKRRTATNIMAGYFDPRPRLSNNPTKSTQHPTQPSSLSPASLSDPAPERPPDETRINAKKTTAQLSKKNRKHSTLSVIEGTVSGNKGNRVKDVHLDNKENAGSHREPPRSSSPRLTSSPPASPLPSVVVSKEKLKASGFWRARSSNTSASPAPSSLKRKLSTASHDDGSHSQVEISRGKKSRLSESLDLEAPSRLFASSDSLSSRSSSLDFDSKNLVSDKAKKEKERRRKSVATDGRKPNKVFTKSLGSISLKGSISHSGIFQSEGDAGPSSEPSESKVLEPKLTRADAPQLYEVIKKAGIRCKLCDKMSINVLFMEAHLRGYHSDKIDMDALPQPPPRKPRGPRKNVAIKKGWKGWVEEDLEPQKLILLDKPEVLPERTTRSGTSDFSTID
ncbi:hypothetical protein Clacol_008948 [Clathrus columnatus]|uniref:Uncharacterized protein n=1 Tax=Clathrus columnatus TaxID=1419009 RepID=A0AAV5ALW8_9AGAM|nr:hypothetical protein Clacol_008948 [Clathrus columnatus]